jgi:hypothetical protein
MNITDKRTVKIQNMGMDPYWIIILYHVKNGSPKLQEIVNHPKARGIVNMLTSKGYLTRECQLTERGEQILIQVEAVDMQEVAPITKKVDTSFEEWSDTLLVTLRGRLKELTGMEQAKGYEGKPFLPNLTDFKGSLLRYKTRYNGMWNEEKIAKMLLSHLEECVSQKKYTPVMQYYIIHKERGSRLADDWNSFTERQEVPKEQQYELIKTKDLF